MIFNITDKDLDNYIIARGYKPACTNICIEKMYRDFKQGIVDFEFYVNRYSLCWYVDEEWKRTNNNGVLLLGNSFSLNIRGFKLDELLLD